jgi:hypothetical protein
VFTVLNQLNIVTDMYLTASNQVAIQGKLAAKFLNDFA